MLLSCLASPSSICADTPPSSLIHVSLVAFIPAKVLLFCPLIDSLVPKRVLSHVSTSRQSLSLQNRSSLPISVAAGTGSRDAPRFCFFFFYYARSKLFSNTSTIFKRMQHIANCTFHTPGLRRLGDLCRDRLLWLRRLQRRLRRGLVLCINLGVPVLNSAALWGKHQWHLSI